MSSIAQGGALSIGLVAIVVAGACGGSNNKGFGFNGGGNDASTGDDTSTSGGDDGGPSYDGSLIGTGDDGGVTGTKLGCSPDLHNVVNATTGVVVQTCPANEGCAAGMCVPACQAAGASHGNIGCDFLVATPSFFADYTYESGSYYSPCFAVFLANNWGTPMTITVTRSGMTYDATSFGRIPVAGM